MKRHSKKSSVKTPNLVKKAPTNELTPQHASVRKDLLRTIFFITIILVLEFLVFFANVNTKIVQIFHH